jgi:hypothetical protein
MGRLKYKYVILLLVVLAAFILLALKLHHIVDSPERGSEHIGYPF